MAYLAIVAYHERQVTYPMWVKFSTWGVSGRSGLWIFTFLCLAIAIACVVYGFWDDRFYYIGIGAFLAAMMYWSSIKWIDRHGSWD